MDGRSASPGPAPSSRPPWALEGRRLGRYRLGPSLGRGGMGEVFEAWDTLLSRPVAVKTLNVPHPAAILRFMKEAQLQARVSHPNVCRIFDVEIADSVPVIAMQLVRGPSLYHVAPDLSLEEAVEILATVAQAMHAAHRVNLIHRDLKPSNILMERSPAGAWVPYVADFGLAKDLEDEGLTQTQGVLGTPTYMAPEQRRGEAALVGPQTDIYALGATLCAVLNLDRRNPVRAVNGTTGSYGETGPLPRWSGIPRPLRTILRRCLEERPRDRYPTAAALAEDLRRFLDGEPLAAEHRGWLRRARGILWRGFCPSGRRRQAQDGPGPALRPGRPGPGEPHRPRAPPPPP
jgi:eukaryotic-like serine/threonine-protein kinase